MYTEEALNPELRNP
jgi:Na+-driven multidrug efflux pump